MSRNIRLPKDRETKLLRYCEEEWYDCQSDWAKWRENLPRWTNAYRGFVNSKTDPWPGCSNLRLPITAIATERMHSTLMGVLDDPETLIRVKPTDYGDVRGAKAIQLFANHSFFHEMGLPEALDRLAHKTCRNGMSAGVLRWTKDLRKVRECWPVMETELGGKRDARAFCEYFYGPRLVSVENNGDGRVKCRYVDDEAMTERTAYIRKVEEGRADPRDGELEFEVSSKVLRRDCPTLDLPAVDDVLFTPDSARPEDASVHFYSLWQTLDELQGHERSGYYEIDSDLMDQLVEDWEGKDTADEEGLAGLGRSNDDEQGPVALQQAMRRSKFHVQKVFLKWDVDDDDEPVEVIATILRDARSTSHLLRLEYLESVFPHGKRPFIWFNFIYLDDVPVAIGVPEFFSAVQAEIDTLFNQINDSNSVRNNPWFAYDPGSSLVPSSIRVRPGQGIPATPGSIWMPTFQNNSSSDMQTVGMLMELAERMIPHGDVAAGRSSGGNRTAGGLAMMMQQAQTVWDKYIKRFGKAVEDVCEQAIGLYSAYMPAWKEFRVASTQEIVKMERRALRGKWDYTIRASMLTANKEIQRAYALQRFQLLAQHPFYQSEEKQYVLVKDILESQEVRNIPEHLGPEPEATRHPYLDPSVEHSIFATGVPWEPHADEDHERHLLEHQTFLLTPASRFGNTEVLVFQHMQHHQRFMAQAQRQKQQQAMGIPQDGAQPGADFGQAGGMNPMMNSLQQQPGAMVDAAQTGMMG